MTSRQWVRVAWWSWLSLLLLIGMGGTHYASMLRVEQVAQARADAYHDALRLSQDDIFLTVQAQVSQEGQLLDAITEVSGPTQELLGWSHEDLRGRSIDVLMGSDRYMVAAHQAAMGQAVKARKVGHRSAIRCNVTTKEGQPRPVIILATADRIDRSGTVTYECVIISLLHATTIDLTKADRAQQTLERILRVVEQIRDEPRQQQTVTVTTPTLADVIREELSRELKDKGLQ